ncbi:MAG: nitrate/sulfonate/bicarbonate ABC transporter ATP-binding protein [Candidatus Cloacimonetes bacterium HGW-Cloacimonetes-1]|jgi:ABC-type nitrate/sulfonate/bicarbonate transport system ATPase subunit|nr:MAG: nitrate/sulfonate/bicarbonate ABC transporter ATP-binding protein [Candidatus Cloacimonetes bacterium HGW-Cloacimonetes-1]
MAALLRTENISKAFLFQGRLMPILEEACFAIEKGEFVSILGASGCGKSTFLELLCGISKPDKGHIIYQNQEITGKSGILGYMPQDDLLFPWLTVQENAMLPIKVKNGSVSQAMDRSRELARILGLEKHLHHYPWQLSGGLKQRTAFLRTCMMGSEVLLLDEPFANLDALTRILLQDWLAEISKQLHLTIVLVTHDIDEAIKLSDRMYLMTIAPGRFETIIEKKQFSDKAERRQVKQDILDHLIRGIKEV